MTRASIAGGLPLVMALISLRAISIAEQSDRNPIGSAVSIALLIALFPAMVGLVALINRHRAPHARGRRKLLLESGRPGWLADVQIDSESSSILGLSGHDSVRTFALIETGDGFEFWGDASDSAPAAAIEPRAIRGVEAMPLSWGFDSGGAIALYLLDSEVLIDIVGGLYGSLPTSRAQQRRVVERLLARIPA